jgi:hypothetical protein
MKGFSTNIVNLISDNLRDRYQGSFQIIKELLQNADDAKNPSPKHFKFGKHNGFPESSHPLLKGPALYFFNDGGFSKSDQRAIRSFAENSKAADENVIGKFGLGMKSIFHLCEAFFYIAKNGAIEFCEGLNPWKQDEFDLHPDWDEVSSDDWRRIKAIFDQFCSNAQTPGFMLWLFDPSSKTPSGMLAHYLFKSEENFIADVPPPLRSKESYKTRISTLEEHQKILSDSIEQARNSIVIVSPFISIHAIERDQLIPKISAAIKRKVNVVVYTDSFLDKSGLSLKNSAKRGRKALTDAGVKLKIVNGIHNKTLCRDDDLLVEGSFNWLSAIRDLNNEYQRHEVSLSYQGKEVKNLVDEVLEEMERLETIRNNRN